MEPIKYDPYPDYKSPEYLKNHHEVHECYLDNEDTISPPDVYAYPGVPEIYPEPFYGSYSTLGMRDDVCFERFGRLGAYGYGDAANQKKHGVGEKGGSKKVLDKIGYTDYSKVNWGQAQERCYEKNKARFAKEQPEGKERVKRHAYV